MFGFHIIREGERVTVWENSGARRIVPGPKILFAPFCDVFMMQQITASDREYLAIKFRDGTAQNRPGPAAEWIDPVLHTSVDVKSALEIDANEAVVIYRGSGEQVQRKILRGPALYVPRADEWLHEFQWHGADPKRPARKKPWALRFRKLRVIPDQMYFDIEDVRTMDEALITVKVMIFFELRNIETMLDQTHDPVADFINAVTADTISFVGSRTFEQFKTETETLNDIQSYGRLTARAQRIGYNVNKVVYRGYHANKRLQEMHDNAIEARTRLVLESETEQTAQNLEDLKLQRGIEREKQEHTQEKKRIEHEQHIRRLAHNEEMHEIREKQVFKVSAKKEMNRLEAEHRGNNGYCEDASA